MTRSHAIIGGVKVGYSQRGYGTKPIEIDVKLPKRAEWMGERILDALARWRDRTPG